MHSSSTTLPVGDLLRNVIDEMLEGLQVIGRDWRYLYVNETVVRQAKSAKEALLNRTMMECFPGIEKTPLFDQLKKCMDERVSIRMENEFAFPDGSKGWFQLYIHPVNEGLMILSVDITERKRAQAALRDKIGELEALMSATVRREMRMAELKQMISELRGLAPSAAAVIEQF